MGLIYYVNHYMPHGEYYPTGEYVSRYEGGPMVEQYKEDLRELNIPNWAKFLRVHGIGLSLILVIAGAVLEGKAKQESNP
jgi:hypothetical protein